VFGRKPGHVLQGPETDKATIQRIREKLSRQESFTEEVLNYRRNGTTYWVSMNIFPIFDETGRPSRYIAIQSDVTQHRQTEQDLKSAKEAAETLNRAKSEFLANISHEIRTPMNAIIGMTELCLDTDLSLEQRDYLNTVHEASNSLLRLLNDILDFSKMEAGKFSIDAINMSLRTCLDVTIKTLALRAHEKGIELATDLAEDIPDALVGDPARLRQIFVNLIGNAIKFTQKGEVVVRGSVKSQTPDNVVLHFTVTDTGIGIPLEQQEQIFAAFTQADSSTKRQFGGTGLGLAITAQLIEMMQGNIWVESVPNQGTTFHFVVTLDRQQQGTFNAASRDAAMPATRMGPPTRFLNILLAEDTPANQRLAKRILEKRGHAVTVAGDGRQAVGLFERERPDLVLMDVQMPVMDGFEATAAIRQAEEQTGEHVPIVAMTAHAMAGDRVRCMEAGMDAYLPKPLDAQELIKLIEDLCTKLPQPKADPSKSPTKPAADASAMNGFDFRPAMRRLEGDVEIFKELAGFFLRDAPGMIAQIRQSIADQNSGQLLHCAHRLKGLISNFDAKQGVESAARLEGLGREGSLAAAMPLCDTLENELTRLSRALEQFCATN